MALLAVAGAAAALWQHFVAAASRSCNQTLADRIVSGLGLDGCCPRSSRPAPAAPTRRSKLLGVPYEFWSLALFVLLAVAALVRRAAAPALNRALAQRIVDLRQHRGARAQLGLAQRVQRPRAGVQRGVQVAGSRVDVEQAGDDLARGLQSPARGSSRPGGRSGRSRRAACAAAAAAVVLRHLDHFARRGSAVHSRRPGR